jgi:type I restriction enzyme S subunit
MSAEDLLGHYERIVDAPDAIARLRRLILDLAVRGKLVPHDPNDEPASELLKRIAVEKARLVKAGQIRNFSAPVNVEDDETPFGLPSSWRWVRLGDVLTKLTDGTHHSPPSEPSGDFRYITAKNIKDDGVSLADVTYVSRKVHDEIYSRCNPEKGDILYIKDGATTGIVTINDIDEPFSMLSSVALLKLPSCLFNRLIVLFLRSPFFYDQMRGFMKGAAITRVTLKRMAPALVPLPPLAEQHRIVAKVDELMALCDRLEGARAEREATRDKLTAASLARLNAPDPETFHDGARFALDALPVLTARPDQIKQLRQTILNLAVRGKLVTQDPKDEPASELLKRIAKEKSRLLKEGKAKRQDSLPEPDLDQAPFELPCGWAWARFPELGVFGRGKSKHRPRNDPSLFEGGEHVMIQTGDVARSRGVIETYTSKYNDFGLSQSLKWPKGTLCITIAANIADSGILGFDACFPDSVVGLVPVSMFENARYFEYFLRTAKANLLEFAPATAQKNINLEILTQVLIPLPPLAEQRRIVVKVDELMALCDRLEASLAIGEDIRRRLLDTLLAQAVETFEGDLEQAA